MTLILALANRDQVIQLSDRKLTLDNGIPFEDSNKATTVYCKDGRFAVGFTGLAKAGKFETQEWLLNSLSETPKDLYIRDLITWLTEKASDDFKVHPSLKMLSPANKRLSIRVTGYVTTPSRRIFNGLVSNYQNLEGDLPEAQDTFTDTIFIQKEHEEKPVMVQRVGRWQAMFREDEVTLRHELAIGSSARDLVNKAVGLMARMADRPEAQNLIGKNISTITIPRDSLQPIFTGFHSPPYNWTGNAESYS